MLSWKECMNLQLMPEKINFAWPVTSENAFVYQYFQTKLEETKSQLEGKRIVIFGAGIRGCCLMQLLESHSYIDIIFCDNNPDKQGHRINQYDIVSLESILEANTEQLIFVSPESSGTLCDQLRKSGLTENQDWVDMTISPYEGYVQEYTREVNQHLLVLGDCAFTHIALEDQNHDSLGDIIKKSIGPGQCKVLAMHGMGQQAYYHILQSLTEQGEIPDSVLLLTVLEVLTSKAHIMPRTQHPELLGRLNELQVSPRKSFSDYAKLTTERFNRFQVESFSSTQSAQGEESEKLVMRMNYMFRLREETEGVIYLKKTVQLLNELSIPCTLYIPPVNYFLGEQYFDEEFKEKYESNFAKLFSILDKDKLKYEVLDVSYLLNQDEFANIKTIDETANFNGRSRQLDYIKSSEHLGSFFRSVPSLSMS